MKANPGIEPPTHPCAKGILLGFAIMLSACGSHPESHYPPATPEVSPAAITIPADAQVLNINPEQTLVHIKVYRDGRLANLGHNHVITAHGVSGRVWIHDNLAQSGFEINIPVAQLVVDHPETRARAGEAFARPISERDAAATRSNLLGDKVLDAARFPAINISTVALNPPPSNVVPSSEKAPTIEVTILVTLKGASVTLVAPVQVKRTGQRLIASGNFSVSQQSLNITPYSALGGALQVRDGIDIEFRIVAVEQAK